MSESIFDKIGGFSTVGKIVHSFYEKVLDEDDLAPFFQGIDMERLVRHQTDFLCFVMGGPVSYTGRALKESHAKLKIGVADFELISDLLEETFEEADLEDKDIASLLKVISSNEDDIVSS